MKLKKNNVDSKKLKKRLIISLTCAALFIAAVYFSFTTISNSEKIGATPKLLRQSFEWNEKIWKKISSNENLSVKKPNPPKGKKPRANGNIGISSPLDLTNYKVTVESGATILQLPISAFQAGPKSDYSTDFRCIEGWSEEMQYAGLRFSDFMKIYNIGKKADGTFYNYVGMETPDKKYYVSLDMESMLHPQTVLVYEMNEAPLRLANGAPLRLLIPIKYGIKSLKRIGKIYFSDTRPPDYWAKNGYDWYAGL